MTKNQKYLTAVAGVALVATVGGGFYFLSNRAGTNFDKNNTTAHSTSGPAQNVNNSTSTPSELSVSTIEITKPVENQNISFNRTIEGKSFKTNGNIYYEVNGEQAGIIASGNIATNDADSEKDFFTEFNYSKKPISGDVGSIDFYVTVSGEKKLIKSVKVGF